MKTKWGKLGRFGPISIFSTPESCPACRREEKRIGRIGNPLDGSQVLATISFWPRQPTLPARDIGFRSTESVVYLFGWSFLPVLTWQFKNKPWPTVDVLPN
jgi:hypothetical protein